MIINRTFHKAIADNQKLPFAWGSNDCCLFVSNVYQAIYGKDLAAGIRGTYDSEFTGMRKVVELGGYDAILTSHGFYKVENLYNVTRGDVVIAENTLGIWVGDKAIFAGNVIRKRDAITAVYRYRENN